MINHLVDLYLAIAVVAMLLCIAVLPLRILWTRPRVMLISDLLSLPALVALPILLYGLVDFGFHRDYLLSRARGGYVGGLFGYLLILMIIGGFLQISIRQKPPAHESEDDGG